MALIATNYKIPQRRGCLWLVILLAYSQTGFGQQEPTQKPASKPDAKAGFVDGMHRGASTMLNNFASQLDSFLGEEAETEVINNTSAVLRFDFIQDDNGSFSLDTKLKLRLVLPRSQQRIRFLFDVDEDDLSDDTRADTRASTDRAVTPGDEDRDVSLALRFIRTARERAGLNVDLGARRQEQQFQAFARLKVNTQDTLDDGWSYRLSNDLRLFSSTGYFNRLEFDFWRPLGQTSTVIRSSTSFEWRRTRPGAVIDQTVGLYKEIDDQSLVAFEALAGYITSPEPGVRNFEGHRVRVRYRRNALRPWFHFEVWPGISWLSVNDNRPRLTALFRMEIGLGNF